MTRKMASIQRIVALTEIPGADRIEVAQVLGWQVVVNKGLYKVNDLVVYAEIDSWIPNSVAPFLTKEGYEPKEYNGVKGERLRTVKLKKQISQGLILPITVLDRPWDAEEGDDVSEALGIQKWEQPEKEQHGSNIGSTGRSFPSFLRKTDQERIQNYSNIIEKELDTEFEITIKKDGSSCTVFIVQPDSPYYAQAKDAVKGKQKPLTMWQKIKAYFAKKYKDEPVIGICSRNQLLPLNGDSNFHQAVKSVISELNLAVFENSYAIQGEVVAPTIQGNYEKVKDVEFHVFDVFNIEEQRYLLPSERKSLMQYLYISNNYPHVTVLEEGKLRDIINYQEGDNIVQKILDYAEGPGDNPGVKREGVVFKAMSKDLSFKAISNSYLLHKG